MSAATPTKAFQSKTIPHILSYPIVSYIVSTVLSISIINYVYTTYVVQLTDFIKSKVLSIEPIYTYLSFADSKIDDSITYGDKLVVEYPIHYVKVTNDTLVSLNDKYIKEEIKIKEEVKDEFTRFFYILNSILINVKGKINSSTSKISSGLVDTYNSELSASKTNGYISKNLEASINTATKTIKNLNDEFITPLKNQTTDYLDQVATTTKTKADTFINEAKQNIISPLNGKVESALNGSAPVVSASA
ncbi:uncharacterized protein RJT21DRAFT_53031 [Scheffersomyces amazonensis]|uniref:uncharacterized protein n=1 Tax=Scheffersomyces amazonensis TaxID=1078765 RepID=UPI00315D46F0